MNTKIVYVLVCEETDFYYEMTVLSLFSFRRYHPKDSVEVVMDKDTYRRLVERRAALLDEVTAIVVSIPPEYSKMQQSRYLKTQLRQLVKGDFLYLDSDTLVCESLEEIDKTDAEIAMVSNGNGDLLREDSFQSEMSQIAGFGKQCDEPIFNGGVLFCRECVSATKLFESWHRFWLQSVKNGVSKDQPSLCYANSYCGHPIRELSGIWNCQLVSPSHKEYFDRSKVLHYWYSVKVESKIGIRLLLTQIKENGFVTKSVASVASNPRTIGYTSLTIDNDRALRFFFSELLYIYDSVHPLYRLCQRLSHLLLKPTQAISRWR